MSEPVRRLRACIENWPECFDGAYNPSCCRFPKSCSCSVYSPEHVTEADLEPAVVAVAVQRKVQRQDSVSDQLNDLRRIAIHEGMYDADDWIKARLTPWDTAPDVGGQQP